MAIGARISSTNLSGKTATVTFTPYTGITSGTTVDLGTQTIPFNNITAHPYGDYAIYLEEYDYTYTLTVPQPNVERQLYVWSSKLLGDYNYGAATFNFTDLTAEIIDLGVDSNLYYLNDLYTINGLGYGYQFNGENNYDDKVVIFTDSENNEVERYSGTTNNYSFDSLDDRWITFEDSDNGVFKYFNGINVYTYTYDSSRYSIDIQWDYDATTADSSFIFAKYDESQGDDNNAYIVKTDGTRTLLKTWSYITEDFDYNFYMQYNDDFIVVEEYYFITNQKSQLQIFDTDLTLLETVLLTGNTYNSRSYGFHGTNKFFYVAYNNDNVDTAYKIIHYNFDTTTLIETSHIRTLEYQFINTSYDSYYADPVSNGVESLVISFYDNDSSNNWGYTVNYYDIMYMLGDDSEFTTYVYANDETKGINTWWYVSDVIRTRANSGVNASILTIMSGSTQNQSLGVTASSIQNTNSWYLDNRTIEMVWVDNLRDIKLFLIGEDGTLQDQKTFTVTTDYGNYSTQETGGKVFYSSFETTTGNTSYYVNDTVTGFTATSFYDSLYRQNQWYNPLQREETNMFLFNEGAPAGRILNADSISDEFELPSWNNSYNVALGKDKFLYAYNDSENSYWHVKMYDYSGNTITTLDTTETNLNTLFAGKDRYIAVFYNSDLNRHKIYMITPSLTKSLTMRNSNSQDGPNDDVIWC